LTLTENAIFTNCGKTPEGDVWWEAMSPEPPPSLIDWRGNEWTPESETPAAHPNARFTAIASQCPVISEEWQDPNGVPISAILFGGRRATVVPLVAEARDWEHGTFMGSIISSEKTAAAAGKIGELRRDPMAMLPFCGYNMGDYWNHWLDIGQKQGAQMPLVYYVNWFRKGDEGRFLWPGFGENSRVLKWIFERCDGNANAVETPIGSLPTPESLDLDGLSLAEGSLDALLTVDRAGWLQELPLIREYYAQFGDRMPAELNSLVDHLEKELSA